MKKTFSWTNKLPLANSILAKQTIVLQARKNSLNKDEKIFNEETEYRKQFVIKSLEEKIDSISAKNVYSDFKKKNIEK